MPSSAVTLALALIGVLAGAALSWQQVVNSTLRAEIGSVWWAGFVSYAGGTLFMLAAALLAREVPPAAATLARVRPMSWTGGLFGGLYIAASIFLVPRFGVAVVIALLIMGQMLSSLLFDQFALGAAAHAITPVRLLGALALIGGVVMIKLG